MRSPVSLCSLFDAEARNEYRTMTHTDYQGPQLNAELLAEDALDLKRQMEETVAIANDPTHKKHVRSNADPCI